VLQFLDDVKPSLYEIMEVQFVWCPWGQGEEIRCLKAALKRGDNSCAKRISQASARSLQVFAATYFVLAMIIVIVDNNSPERRFLLNLFATCSDPDGIAFTQRLISLITRRL
jgi:hypothetical protein